MRVLERHIAVEEYSIDCFENIFILTIENEKQILYKESRQNVIVESSWVIFEVFNDVLYFRSSDFSNELKKLESSSKLTTFFKDTDKNNVVMFFHIGLDYPVFVEWDGIFYNSLTINDEPQEKKIYFNGNIKWKIKEWGSVQFFKNICFIVNGANIKNYFSYNQFTKLNFLSGEREWNFDLEQHLEKLLSTHPFDQPLQVKEPLGVYKDQLWFSMSNYGLLCLNNNTGEFMHYLRDCPENPAGNIYLPYGGYPVIPFTENAVLLAEEGKIVCFDSMFYWQLDLETLELDFHFLEDYFKEVDCYTFRTRFKKLIVEDRKIYMVASKSNKFACFNRDTLKYDWVESLPENSGAPRSIEKHGNKLYIDTSKKELLVYEIENQDN